jgi:hypothetical protein
MISDALLPCSFSLHQMSEQDRRRRQSEREAAEDFFGESADNYVDVNAGMHVASDDDAAPPQSGEVARSQARRNARAAAPGADDFKESEALRLREFRASQADAADGGAAARVAEAQRKRGRRASQAAAADGGAAARAAEAQRRRELRASQADAADGGAAAREAEAQRKRTARLKRTDPQNDAHNARRRAAAADARAQAQRLADGLPVQHVARAAADAMLPDAGAAAVAGAGADAAAADAHANQQHRFLPKNLTADQIRRIADRSFPCDRDAGSIPYIASCLGYLDYKGKFNKPALKSFFGKLQKRHKNELLVVLGKQPWRPDEFISEADYNVKRYVRLYDIEVMTMGVKQCACCSRLAVTPGIVLDDKCTVFQEYAVESNKEAVRMFRADGVYKLEKQHQADGAWELLTDVCKRCHGEVGREMQPTFCPESGFLHGIDVPECLRCLSFAEESLISMINPVLAVAILKNGARKLKGTVSYIDRSLMVKMIANALPRMPADVESLWLEKQTGAASAKKFSMFRVRRAKVEAALRWLIAHSPAYAKVTIDQAALASLPDDDVVEATHARVGDKDGNRADAAEDLGPAPLQRPDEADVPVDEHDDGSVYEDVDLQEGVFVADGKRQDDAADMINRVAAHFNQEGAGDAMDAAAPAGAADAAAAAPAAAPADAAPPRFRQEYSDKFVNPFSTKYFFSMAWPTLFMPERVTDGDRVYADTPAEFSRQKPRKFKCSFVDWAQWLIQSGDGRYMAHPTLKFSLLSMKQREQMRASTSFNVTQMEGAEPPNLAEMKEMLNTPDGKTKFASLYHNIASWGRNVAGSPAYWWSQRDNLAAMTRNELLESDSLPVAFTTGSMAEFYWPEVRVASCISLLQFSPCAVCMH